MGNSMVMVHEAGAALFLSGQRIVFFILLVCCSAAQLLHSRLSQGVFVSVKISPLFRCTLSLILQAVPRWASQHLPPVQLPHVLKSAVAAFNETPALARNLTCPSPHW